MSVILPDYVELHCLSNFSFLRGASHPEELVARAAALGYSALAITDECSFAGSVRAHLAARDISLKLIHGIQIILSDGMCLVLLAENRAGYGNLSALATLGRRRAGKGRYLLSRNDLAGWDGGGIPDCLAILLPDSEKVDAGGTAQLEDEGRWLAEHFPGRAWIAWERHLHPADTVRLARLEALSRRLRLPLVAAGDVHMHRRSRRALQDTLTALRHRVSLQEAGHRLFPNGERHLRSRLALARLYPAPLLAETLAVAERCRFSLDELRYEYPDEIVPAGHDADSWLRELSTGGLACRYPDRVPPAVAVQVEAELALIAELRYAPYFLTVHDIVAWARGQGILCQGRGSAANSAVCYALGITEVDPARASLLFGRFISRERNEPPDIDVDFEHARREEVIQYIYSRYGRERAALAAAVITWRSRGALRDAGRAFGFPREAIDRLAGNLAWWDQPADWPQRCAEAGLDAADPMVRRWIGVARQLVGFPRHLTQHVGGFVIARHRLDRLVPVENAAMPARTVIQWDKDDIDALGLLKVDILALGMLTAIRKALACIGRRLDQVPAEDPATYEMISRADTIGVFQIESRAQMAMLPRLQPRTFYDLVIEVAIVRPGPIQGQMVHPYLRRRQGREPVSYPSDAVRGVLARTLGVPLFQEQAMQLAIVAAGFTAGEADQLRRAMAAWRRRGGLAPFRDRLLAGMRARGYPGDFAENLYRQIEGFADYGFPESHAASFALLVYVSAWLKRHYPAAFLTGLLNAQPMGFYAPAQLIQDARRHGVDVRPVDVVASDWESTLEDGAVRLGLDRIAGLPAAAGQRIATARHQAAFTSLADLARRASLGRRELDLLADADALRALSGHRRQAAWLAAGLPLQLDLLAGLPPPETPPLLSAPGEAAGILADYRRLGFTLGRHPLALLRERLRRARYLPAAELAACGDRALVRTAGLVTCRQRPGTASGVIFLTLEDETGQANIVVFADLAERQRPILLGAPLLGVAGQLQVEGHPPHAVVHLVAGRLFDHSAWLGALAVSSRDFC